jgi:nucleoredoxin
MQRRLAGKLVRHDGSRVQAVGDDALAGIKYYALYYSASWCGPCRQFTPGLVKAYRELKAKHPEFELIFVSADRSASAMADYMKKDGMPWLAVKFDQREHTPEILRYSGPGIPCLVLVASDGRVLADSYEGDNYIGPQSALAQTRRILAKGI